MAHTIEHLPISSLKPDPKNPKAHSLDTIGASLDRFGVVEPIVQDARTGLIISGHGRLRALTDMRDRGEQPPDGVTLDKDGEWCAPVVTGWASASDAEAAAALVALNRSTEIGGWVDDALLAILDELGQDGLTGVGYTDTDLDDLRARLNNSDDFLDDIIRDDGHNPFHAGTDFDTDTVEVAFPMKPVERDALHRRLREVKASGGHDTLTAALLAATGAADLLDPA